MQLSLACLTRGHIQCPGPSSVDCQVTVALQTGTDCHALREPTPQTALEEIPKEISNG
jgi:hypothetical protein